MKLEEILPEIRKGRRFRRKEWNCRQGWTGPQTELVAADLTADDWELEPEAIHLGAGAVAHIVYSDRGNVNPAYTVIGDDNARLTLLATEIDALKTAADQARGRSAEYVPPAYVPDTGMECANHDPSLARMREQFYRAGHRAGWDQAVKS